MALDDTLKAEIKLKGEALYKFRDMKAKVKEGSYDDSQNRIYAINNAQAIDPDIDPVVSHEWAGSTNPVFDNAVQTLSKKCQNDLESIINSDNVGEVIRGVKDAERLVDAIQDVKPDARKMDEKYRSAAEAHKKYSSFLESIREGGSSAFSAYLDSIKSEYAKAIIQYQLMANPQLAQTLLGARARSLEAEFKSHLSGKDGKLDAKKVQGYTEALYKNSGKDARKKLNVDIGMAYGISE